MQAGGEGLPQISAARMQGARTMLAKTGGILSNVRVTDAKEVGVGNPAEETCCHPDAQFIAKTSATVKPCC